MKPEKKELRNLIRAVEQHLSEGTIYESSFKEKLNKAKKRAGMESASGDSYTENKKEVVLR